MTEKSEELLSDEAENKCPDVSSAELETMFMQGKAYYDMGEYDEARALWTKAAALGDANSRDVIERLLNEFEIKDGVLVKYKGKGGDVKIPDGVTSIGEDVFEFCGDLSSIEIPSSVTSIGRSMFTKYSSITNIYYMGDIARWCGVIGLENLMPCGNTNNALHISGKDINGELVIPDGVTSIGNCAFFGCSGLTSIDIPNSVTSIGNRAFADCSGLMSIDIPSSVTSIGDRAFADCSGLTSIDIPSSVTSIGDWAFAYCSGLTSITIPNGVTSIGGCAFIDCSGLTSIEIPSSITSVNGSAFWGCIGLTKLTVSSGNEQYKSVSNCLIDVKSKTLISGCKSSVIPDDGSVTGIEEYAFNDCSSLTSITIPDGVTSIGESAFSGCSGLTSITIPNSVTSIGYYAFKGCRSLTSVNIPFGITEIYVGVFSDCTGLTSVTMSNTLKAIGGEAFSGCEKLNEIVFCGTKREWKKVTKYSDWNKGVPAEVVICSNGKVKIK